MSRDKERRRDVEEGKEMRKREMKKGRKSL